ncbi:MAG: deoxycytidylate deaminase [Oscillospiraceae bacterium]
MDTRMGKEDYYLDIADAVLNRSTCMRRKYGAIIVRNDEILSTGYQRRAPRPPQLHGRRHVHARDVGHPSGERYELCRSVHAEANAIISAARRTCWAARCISWAATPRRTSCSRRPCPARCASGSS